MNKKKMAALFALAVTPLLSQEHKLSSELQSLYTQSTLQIIVQYKHDPTSTDHQRMIDRGGKVNRVMHSIQAGSYSLPGNALADLEQDPNIAHVSINHKVNAKLDYANAAINASTARQTYGVNGAGVGVAVIDSGLTHDTDFGKGARIVYQNDFLGGNDNDKYGHGQHVAAIIAGDGSAAACSTCTRNLAGIAPGANILNLRVLDQNGETDDSTLVAAIDLAIQLKSQYNVRVINLSVGRPVFESYTVDPLCQAAEAAWKAGIVVVVAAGNEGRDNLANNYGYGTITSPGNDPYVITVGAMKTMETYSRTDDLIASYSSKGPTLIDNIVKPDLVAPGNRVVSSLAASTSPLAKYDPINLIPTSYYDSKGNSTASSVYYTLSGTSMAAAVVSGAVADLLQAQPTLTPDQVKARLMQTAYKTFPASSTATDPTTGASYISYYDIFTRGAGYLDLNAALASKTVATGTALSPTVTFNTSTQQIYVTFQAGSVWANAGATNAVWGNKAVWGTTVLSSTSTIVSQSAVWGTKSVWGNRSVWGTKSVWGTDLLDAYAASSPDWGASTSAATSSNASDAISTVVFGEQ